MSAGDGTGRVLHGPAVNALATVDDFDGDKNPNLDPKNACPDLRGASGVNLCTPKGNRLMEPIKPMAPMKPMEPMEPMEPMKPMTGGEKWWPEDLGQPSASGGQNGMRYAFFPDKRRLLIDENGKVNTYDTGHHRIGGVSQQDSHERTLTFTSQSGPVKLDELSKVT